MCQMEEHDGGAFGPYLCCEEWFKDEALDVEKYFTSKENVH